MNARKIVLAMGIGLAAIGACAPSAQAQSRLVKNPPSPHVDPARVWVDRSFQKSYGNVWAGAQFRSNVAFDIGRSRGEFKADAQATATVLKRRLSLFQGRVRSTKPGRTDNLVRLGRLDVLSAQKPLGTRTEFRRSFDLPVVAATIWIVTIKAGVGARVDFRAVGREERGSLAGEMSFGGRIYGWASASVSVGVAGARLRAELQLLTTRLEANARADKGRIRGRAQICLEPVRVELTVTGWLGVWPFKATKTWRLASWSSRRLCSTLFQF